MYLCMYAYMYVCIMYVCIYVCTYVCMTLVYLSRLFDNYRLYIWVIKIYVYLGKDNIVLILKCSTLKSRGTGMRGSSVLFSLSVCLYDLVTQFLPPKYSGPSACLYIDLLHLSVPSLQVIRGSSVLTFSVYLFSCLPVCLSLCQVFVPPLKLVNYGKI